jgi:hypothetical protein
MDTTDFCGVGIKDPKGKSWHAYDWGSSDGVAHSKSHHRTMAGCRITPVLGFWTLLDLHSVKFALETGFELPSSCVDLP